MLWHKHKHACMHATTHPSQHTNKNNKNLKTLLIWGLIYSLIFFLYLYFGGYMSWCVEVRGWFAQVSPPSTMWVLKTELRLDSNYLYLLVIFPSLPVTLLLLLLFLLLYVWVFACRHVCTSCVCLMFMEVRRVVSGLDAKPSLQPLCHFLIYRIYKIIYIQISFNQRCHSHYLMHMT